MPSSSESSRSSTPEIKKSKELSSKSMESLNGRNLFDHNKDSYSSNHPTQVDSARSFHHLPITEKGVDHISQIYGKLRQEMGMGRSNTIDYPLTRSHTDTSNQRSQTDLIRSYSRPERLAPSSPEEHALWQQLEDGQKKLEKNMATIHAARGTLDAFAHKAEDLVKWKPKDHVRYLQEKWHEDHPGVQWRDPEKNIYNRINFAKRIKVELQEHLKDLGETRKYMMREMDMLYPISPIKEDHDSLQEKIKNLGNSTTSEIFANYAAKQNDIWQQNSISKAEVLTKAGFQIERIKTSIKGTEKALENAGKRLKALEQEKPKEHPFFHKKDLPRPDEKTKSFVVPGELPGAGVAQVIIVLLRKEGIYVTEEHLAKTLGLHPLGGIDVTRLHEKIILPSHSDKKGPVYWKIEPENLGRVMGEGPIGAILHIPEFGRLAVILDHIGRDSVALLDDFHPEPYKVSFAEFADVWDGDVILPRKALFKYAVWTKLSNEEDGPSNEISKRHEQLTSKPLIVL